MAVLKDIREGIRDAIVAAFPDVQCTGFVLGSPTPPAVDVDMADEGVRYHDAANDGAETWTMLVRGIVPHPTEEGAAHLISSWYGSDAGSLKAALEADQTLGGVCDAVQVVRQERPVQVTPSDGSAVVWLGTELIVEVLV